VRATSPLEVLRISKEHFLKLLSDFPHLGVGVMRVLAVVSVLGLIPAVIGFIVVSVTLILGLAFFTRSELTFVDNI